MKVQKIEDKATGRTSYTLLSDDYRVIDPAEHYLAFLSNVGRSPNTVRAYANALRLWLVYLEERSIPWDATRMLEVLGEFASWLQRHKANTIVLTGEARRSRRTVNLYLTVVYDFYTFHSRNGVCVLDSLIGPAKGKRNNYKHFLHGLTDKPNVRNLVHLREPRRIVQALTLDQALAVIAAQNRLRNKFLFALMLVTGMRIGQALGLRHEDFISRHKMVRIVARDNNANGARAKAPVGEVAGESPITAELVNLYSEYMHEEYGDLDSDYVFVNLWGGDWGKPMTYNAVNDLVIRTRVIVGFHFTPHQYRHTFATIVRKAGVSIDILSKLLTHKSVTTTSDIYTHLDVEFMREELLAAGVMERVLGEVLP